VTAYSYDDAGRMTTATLPSGTGIVSTYTYDVADRLTNIAHVKGGSTTVASVAYTLDDVGNRTQRVDQQGTHTYAYDDLHRLTSVTYPGPSTTTYDFDAFGNRTEMVTGAGTTDYTYDDADRLTEVDPPAASPIAYTWDDNGNLTDRGSDEFEWDFEDRMIEATVNSVTTNFVYRGDGLRDSRAVSGGATTTFTWDIAFGLPVVLDDGNQYVYGAGLNAMKQGGNWFYYLADGLGSTMAIVDATGVSQKSYTYDVYGEATPTGGLANEFDFAGQQTDATGLQYLRARHYDPETGTFLSRDPMAAHPAWAGHPFGYASASVPNLSDPTGLFSPLPPCVLSGSCLCKVGVLDCDKGWPGDACTKQPLGGPCLGPPRTSFTLDAVRLVGEYLFLGNLKFNVKQPKSKPIPLERANPREAALDLFEAIRKSSGSPAVQYEIKNGRLRLFFQTKDGVVVNYRIGKVGDTPSVDLGYPGQEGNIKLKFIEPVK